MNCFCLLTVGGPTAADGYTRKYQPSLFHILVINVFSSHDPILIWFINLFLLFPTLCTVCGPPAADGLGVVPVPVYILMWHSMYKMVSRLIYGVSAVFWTTLGCGLIWVAMTFSWILSGRRLGRRLGHASLAGQTVEDSWCVRTWKYSLTNAQVV